MWICIFTSNNLDIELKRNHPSLLTVISYTSQSIIRRLNQQDKLPRRVHNNPQITQHRKQDKKTIPYILGPNSARQDSDYGGYIRSKQIYVKPGTVCFPLVKSDKTTTPNTPCKVFHNEEAPQGAFCASSKSSPYTPDAMLFPMNAYVPLKTEQTSKNRRNATMKQVLPGPSIHPNNG